MERINCRACEYFYITWDQAYPFGCRAFGCKTASLPSIVVKQSSGESCMKFVQKTKN